MQDMKLLAIQDVLKELMPFLLKEDEMPEEIDPTEDMELPEEGEVVIEIEMEPEGGDEEIAEMVDEEDDEEEIDIKKLLGIR